MEVATRMRRDGCMFDDAEMERDSRLGRRRRGRERRAREAACGQVDESDRSMRGEPDRRGKRRRRRRVMGHKPAARPLAGERRNDGKLERPRGLRATGVLRVARAATRGKGRLARARLKSRERRRNQGTRDGDAVRLGPREPLLERVAAALRPAVLGGRAAAGAAFAWESLGGRTERAPREPFGTDAEPDARAHEGDDRQPRREAARQAGGLSLPNGSGRRADHAAESESTPFPSPCHMTCSPKSRVAEFASRIFRT